MAKRSYTWYPQDWATDSAVFNLNLEQRGLYRELIDLVMLHEGKVQIDAGAWARRFNCDSDSIYRLLVELEHQDLIYIEDSYVVIPSCEKRLLAIEKGRISASKRWKNSEPNDLPNGSPNGVVNGEPNGRPNAKVKDKVKDKNKGEKTPKRFTPPTLQELSEYTKQRGGLVNPHSFYNFYEAKGWMVGKNKMKDWKAAVRSWETRSEKNAQTGSNRKRLE